MLLSVAVHGKVGQTVFDGVVTKATRPIYAMFDETARGGAGSELDIAVPSGHNAGRDRVVCQGVGYSSCSAPATLASVGFR